MAAAVLSLALTVIVAGAVWLGVGNLLRLSEDERQNDLLNILCYAAVLLPALLALVFFGIERL